MARESIMAPTTRKLLFIGGLIVVLTSIFAFGWRLWTLSTFARQRDAGLELIDLLRQERPQDVSKESWEIAVDWTTTAYLNVFSSVDNPTSANIKRFNRHAEDIVNSSDGIVMIERIWEELAQAGPHGQEYVDKFYPEFRNSYEANEEKSKRAGTRADANFNQRNSR